MICSTSLTMATTDKGKENGKMKRFIILMSLTMTQLALSDASIKSWRFDQNDNGWKTYNRTKPKATISWSEEGNSSAKGTMKNGVMNVITSGEGALEGASATINVPPERAYEITARVKGTGVVMLATHGVGGWVYGKKITLGENWKNLSSRRFAKGPRLRIALLTCAGQPQDAAFHVDEVSVKPETTRYPPAAEIDSIVIDPKSGNAPNVNVVEGPTPEDDVRVEGKRHYWLATDVPFPQTSKPVWIYLKARALGDPPHSIAITHDRQTAQTANVIDADRWQWLKTGPFTAGEMGTSFAVRSMPLEKNSKVQLNSLVLSTNDSLTDETLTQAVERHQQNTIPARLARVAVGLINEAPTIDGDLSDPAWRRSVEIGPFTLLRSTKAPKAGTTARLCADDQNLYVAFRCEEPVLIPANNQLDAFKATPSSVDDKSIMREESVAVLLDANGDRDTFKDLIVNAAGAVNDARCGGPSPWSDRDETWNSDATTATKQGDGFWTLEMAIPLASLEATPKAGDRWNVCLGRIRIAERETSSWQPLDKGFHDPSSFAELAFMDGDEIPGVNAMILKPFAQGDNALSLRASPGVSSNDLRVETVLKPATKSATLNRKDYPLSKDDTNIDAPFVIADGGKLAFQFRLIDPSTLNTIYQSPTYERDVTVSMIRPRIQSDFSFSVFVNGVKANAGRAMKRGANVIAIESEGPISGFLAVGDHVIKLDETWVHSTSPQGDWASLGHDTTNWSHPKVVDGCIGEIGKMNVFRKIILIEQSRFWPNWDKNGVHVGRDSLQMLYLMPEAIDLPGDAPGPHDFLVELPSSIELVGASCHYGTWPVKVERLGEVKRKGVTFNVVKITPAKIWPRGERMRHHKMVCLVIRPTPSAELGRHEARIQATAKDGYIQEIPKTLWINVLPKPNGKQPKTYDLQLWTGFQRRLDDPGLTLALLDDYAQMGFHSVGHDRPGDFPVKTVGCWHIPKCGKLFPNDRMVDSKGENIERVCPALLESDTPQWRWLTERIAQWYKRIAPNIIHWDYEFNPFDAPYLACYCPRCLRRFKEAAGIDDDVELTPQRIEEKYPDQWIDFMTTRMATIAGRFRDEFKKLDSNVIFSVYSGYQSERTKEHYGVDWAKLNGNIDVASCGYGRDQERIQATKAALGDTPLVLGAIVRPYRESERSYPNFISEATTLRRVLDGTGGMLIFSSKSLDGRTYQSVARISRVLADFEDLFINRRHANAETIEFNGAAGDEAITLTDENGTRILAMVLNEGNADKPVTITMKKNGYHCHNAVNGEDLGEEQSVSTSIQPGGIAVLAFERK